MKILKKILTITLIFAVFVVPFAFLNGCKDTPPDKTNEDLSKISTIIDRAVTTLGFDQLSEDVNLQPAKRVRLSQKPLSTNKSYDEMDTLFDPYLTVEGAGVIPIEFILSFTGAVVQLRAVDLALKTNTFNLNQIYGQEIEYESVGEAEYTYTINWNEQDQAVEIKSTLIDSYNSGQINHTYSITQVKSYGENGFELKTRMVNSMLLPDLYCQYQYMFMSIKADEGNVDEMILPMVVTYDNAITTQTIDQWVGSGKSFSVNMAGSYKNGNGPKELSEVEEAEIAKIMVEDLGINYTGFNELFNVQYQNVTWIQQAADDCRELVNRMNGVE
jgi:hypothetical protein